MQLCDVYVHLCVCVCLLLPGCRRDAFTMNMLEIPQGAGSGFLWDDKGEAADGQAWCCWSALNQKQS